MLNSIRKMVEKFQELFLALVGLALMMIIVVVSLQTFTRFVIFKSLPWSEELSRYLFVFIIIIGLNVVIKDDMLIRIDLIDYIIKGRGAVVIKVLRIVIGLVVSVMVGFNATLLFRIGMVQKSPAMQLPMIIIYIIICLGFMLAAISMLFKLIDGIKELCSYGKVIENPESEGGIE